MPVQTATKPHCSFLHRQSIGSGSESKPPDQPGTEHVYRITRLVAISRTADNAGPSVGTPAVIFVGTGAMSRYWNQREMRRANSKTSMGCAHHQPAVNGQWLCVRRELPAAIAEQLSIVAVRRELPVAGRATALKARNAADC